MSAHPHTCPYCGAEFDERDELTEHLTGKACSQRKDYEPKHRGKS